MSKKHNKDFLERLINHTMRHGKKGAAIGLLTKSFLLFRQNLTRQAAVSRGLEIRRTEERPKFLCTLLNSAAASHQSPSTLGVNTNQGGPVMATISPHANKEIESGGPQTNHNQSTYCKQCDQIGNRLVTTLAFSVVVSSSFPSKASNLQETGLSTGGSSPFNQSSIDQYCKKPSQSYRIGSNVVTNLWSGEKVDNRKIGNTASNFMSCNKMPSATTERRTSSALMCVQDVFKDKKEKTQVITNQSIYISTGPHIASNVTRLVTSRNGRPSIKGFVKDAISNVKPSLETRKKKIAGITRHVPSIVSPSRGEGLAIRWVLAAAKEKQRKGGKNFSKCLSDELLDAYLKRGEARQKRDSLHKLAESNRSYVRYRWW